ncbi:hypothetical protein KIF24_01090 [Micromonospora sp. Llam7]|uniref:DUF6197 family protein n=1 Tax=Micromonospora tarapacensis TaxID=2835305 RepID=UPI001C83F4A4|nr:hypothetical protein [Micromonospora tarapacensis]MBX7264787.1 hypothetical protein [Micromonospora tarapacensis]
MHATQNEVAEQVTTPARTLRDAALYLSRHGWTQGAYYDATSGSFTPPACLVGAVGMVCYGGPVDAPAQMFDAPEFADFESALVHLDRHLDAVVSDDEYKSGFDTVYDFNDAKDRTSGEVIAVLRAAANEWDRTNGGAA